MFHARDFEDEVDNGVCHMGKLSSSYEKSKLVKKELKVCKDIRVWEYTCPEKFNLEAAFLETINKQC